MAYRRDFSAACLGSHSLVRKTVELQAIFFGTLFKFFESSNFSMFLIKHRHIRLLN